MRCGQRCVRAAQFGALLLVAACSTPSPPPPASESGASATQSPSRDAAAARNPPGPDELPPVASPYDVLPEAARARLDRLFVGDLDQMVSRRLIRAGVVFNRTQYFIDGGTQRGLAYESLRLFEEQLNKRLKTGALPVHVAFVPLSRDQLFPALIDGKVDLAAAALTITPEREKLVRFSHPTRADVSEIVVTPKGAPPLTRRDRPVQPPGLRAAKQQLLRQPRPPERRPRGGGQSAGDPQGSARGPGRRRPPRDGERRTRRDDRGRRFRRHVLAAGLHESPAAPTGSGAHRRHDCGRGAPEQSRRCWMPSTSGSRSTVPARRSATSWTSAICRTPVTPRAPRAKPNGKSSNAWSACSRSTASNTTSTTY